jgi:hypothetical protein
MDISTGANMSSKSELTILADYALRALTEKGLPTDQNSVSLVARTLAESLSTKYHAVALDVEGTVTQSGTIKMEEDICNTIAGILKKGVYVIFVSGSGRTTVKSILTQLASSLPNGDSSYRRLYAISGNGCRLVTINSVGQFSEQPIARPLKKILGEERYQDLVQKLRDSHGSTFEITEKDCGIRLEERGDARLSEVGQALPTWFDSEFVELKHEGVKVASGQWGTKKTYDITGSDKDYSLCWFYTEYDFIDVPLLRIGDQGIEGANDFFFLDSQYGFSVGSLSQNMTRCLPVYSSEEKRVLLGVEGTNYLLRRLKWGPSLRVPSFHVPNLELEYEQAAERLLQASRQEYLKLYSRWSKEASEVLTPMDIDKCVATSFACVFDHKSGAIFFSNLDWRMLTKSPKKDFFELKDEAICKRGLPGLMRCVLSESGRIMRGPRYYVGLVEPLSPEGTKILVGENSELLRLIQKEIDVAHSPRPLSSWKLELAVLDQFRNNNLLLYSMLFQAASLNTASQAYWKRLLRDFEKYTSASIALYYSMLMTDLAAFKTSLVYLNSSIYAFYELRNVAELLCRFLEGHKIDPGKIIRKWREADHPGQILCAIWSAQQEMQESFDARKRLCALGIMYGGVELPFVFRHLLSKGTKYKLSIAHIGGISVYSRGRESLIMEQYSKDVLESAIPNADRLDEIMTPEDVVVPMDDNIMTGRTMEIVRDRLNAYGVEVPFCLCVRFPPAGRIHHMAKWRHGGIDPDGLGKEVRGLVAQSPYSRLFSKAEGYKDTLGNFDLSRKRIEDYLKKNGCSVVEDRQ